MISNKSIKEGEVNEVWKFDIKFIKKLKQKEQRFLTLIIFNNGHTKVHHFCKNDEL